MTPGSTAADRAALPRHVPRGVRSELDTLVGLRRFGAEMRALLMPEMQRREGSRSSASRGHGMDYVESRRYSPGDDVRRIDWRVTARTGRTHTKLFLQERGRDIFCIVDQRRSMHFGTRAAFKSVLAGQLAALAGWAAADGGDRFGAQILNGRGASVLTGAASGSVPVFCALLASEPSADEDSGTCPPLEAIAARAADEAAIGTRFVVVTDLADTDESLAASLKALRSRGDIVLVWVFDTMEIRLPPPARYPLTDGREHLVLDTARAGVREMHAHSVATRGARLALLAAQPGTRCHAVQTGADVFAALARPFSPADPEGSTVPA